jgi:uncharacterized phage-associated protein
MATASAHTSLPKKLKAVLARVCEHLGSVTKTKAVKLPYLVDVVASHVLGRRITEGTHETWDYGVVTREVYRAITHLDLSPDFVVEAHNFSEGGQLIKPGSAGAGALSDAELRLVDEVTRTFGALDAGSLGQLTKALNTDLCAEVWGSNRLAAVDDDAFARLSIGWQSFAHRLGDLDLTNRANWGSHIDDPAEHLRRALGAG